MLRIETRDGRTEFAPGATVEGRFEWSVRRDPKRVSLRLIWYTQGKGTQDIEIIEEIEVDDPSVAGEQSFRFTLPDSPYSFSGKLISLTWALELVTKRDEDSLELSILVSPWVKQVELSQKTVDG